MKSKTTLCLLALLIGLTGCVTEKLPPVSLYTLDPDLDAIKAPVVGENKTGKILMLGRISSTQPFSGPEMLYSDAQLKQNSYAYSRWSSPATVMLLSIFEEAIEKSGQYRAVVPYSSQARSDLLLEGTLFDFSHHIKKNGTSEGVVKISFKLIDSKTRKVMASRMFVSSVPASEANAPAAAMALNQAVTNVIRELLDWLKKQSKDQSRINQGVRVLEINFS